MLIDPSAHAPAQAALDGERTMSETDEPDPSMSAKILWTQAADRAATAISLQ
jgi:hypothetical protein